MEEPNREQPIAAELLPDPASHDQAGAPEEAPEEETAKELPRNPASDEEEKVRELDEVRRILVGRQAPENEKAPQLEADLRKRIEGARHEIVDEIRALESRLRGEVGMSTVELCPTNDHPTQAHVRERDESIAALDDRVDTILELATNSHREIKELQNQSEALRTHIRGTESTLEELLSLVRQIALDYEAKGAPTRQESLVPDKAARGQAAESPEGTLPEEVPPGKEPTHTGDADPIRAALEALSQDTSFLADL